MVTPEGRARAVIEGVFPEIDGGRFPIKRVVGEQVVVEADVFADGHDAVACSLLYRRGDSRTWQSLPMESLGNDRWRASFPVEATGLYSYTLLGWVDHFLSWRRDLEKRALAGQDLGVPFAAGAGLVEEAAERAAGEDGVRLRTLATALRGGGKALEMLPSQAAEALPGGEMMRTAGASAYSVRPAVAPALRDVSDPVPVREEAGGAGLPGGVGTPDGETGEDPFGHGRSLVGPPADEGRAGADGGADGALRGGLHADGAPPERLELALSEELLGLMTANPDLRFATRYGRELSVEVDRPRAGFSAWYELFPRSASTRPGQHGTFRDVEARLPYVAEMGFDVLYLPPIHPIGESHRKGRNNSTQARPGDPGSPWAIGSRLGGHKAVHPELGTLDEFRRLVAKATDLGMEIALDIAFQCSPDHPYVREHPEWFKHRPDGSIQYAENPPKKYEDIYPFDFQTADWRGLWDELKSVFLFWAEQGVRIFRVDNPHTKALPFWEWAIAEVKREHQDVLFLAEAFTRPKVMYLLAKTGFTQSYTYFAWRHSKRDLTEYAREVCGDPVRQLFRPSFWPNTPDILTEPMQQGGRPTFMARLVLAATLSSNYGIYGPAFELIEHAPREPSSEEYLDSEKYQIRHWDIDRPDSLRGLIGRVNEARRGNAALQSNEGLVFHSLDNDALICYSKRAGGNAVLVVVNLDPHYTQSGWVHLSMEDLGLAGDQGFTVEDLLTGARYPWHGPHNYVELNPQVLPAHLFRVEAV